MGAFVHGKRADPDRQRKPEPFQAGARISPTVDPHTGPNPATLAAAPGFTGPRASAPAAVSAEAAGGRERCR